MGIGKEASSDELSGASFDRPGLTIKYCAAQINK